MRDDKGAVEVNLWDSAHVIRGGIKLQSLTDLDATALETELLTPAFSPTPVQPDVACAQGEAYRTCAAALADATGCWDDKVFQINRCYMHLPLSEEYLFTPEGEPKLGQCRLWDRSGTVEGMVVANAFAPLFGCKDLAEVKDKAQKGTLEVLQTRLNVRGVLRQETIDGQALPVGVGNRSLRVSSELRASGGTGRRHAASRPQRQMLVLVAWLPLRFAAELSSHEHLQTRPHLWHWEGLGY